MIAAQTAPIAFSCRVAGLHINSPIELPCGLPVAADRDAPDVQMAARPVPERLADAHHRGPNWEVSPSRILLRIPKLARILIRAGREVDYQLEPGANEAALPLFLAGSALGAILHQRGEFVLHAAAVETGGGAVVFCGQSGAGKSSLVGALCAAGHRLLADDVCRVQFGPGGPVVVPDGRRLKLWRDTMEHLGLDAGAGERVRPGIDKFRVAPPSGISERALPLRAVYILQAGEEAGLTQAPVLNAVEYLRAFAYRPRLVKALGQEALWLNRSTEVAARVPFHFFTRPWALGRLGDGTAALEAQWREKWGR